MILRPASLGNRDPCQKQTKVRKEAECGGSYLRSSVLRRLSQPRRLSVRLVVYIVSSMSAKAHRKILTKTPKRTGEMA